MAGVPTFFGEEGSRVLQFDLQQREDLEETLQFEGSTEPRGFGGFTNIFSYKGFTLNILLTYKFGYVIRLNDAFFATYNDFGSLPGQLADRWAVPGDETRTDIPVILDRNVALFDGELSQAYQLYNKSTVRVANGDHIRLKTVRLSYGVPATFVQKIGLNTASLSLEGQNLALLYADWENLRGQDPEFFGTGGVSLPQPRLITFSLNVGF